MDIYKVGFKYHGETQNISSVLRFVFKEDLSIAIKFLEDYYKEEDCLDWNFEGFETLEQYIQDTDTDFEQICDEINSTIKDAYIEYSYDDQDNCYKYTLYSFDEEVLKDYFCDKFPEMLNEDTIKKIVARKI